MHEIRAIFEGILKAVNQGQPIALLVLTGLTALTEVGIPTFGLIDAVLLYVGYQFGLLSFRALLIIALLTLGRIIGSSAIFWPSRILGNSFTGWFEKRYPSISLKINQVIAKLKRRQALSVVIVRFTPGLLTAGSVAAGMLKINYGNFTLGVAIHAIIADVVLILIGYLGQYGITLAGIHPQPWQVITAAVLLVIGVSAGVFFYQRLKARRKNQKPEHENAAGKNK